MFESFRPGRRRTIALGRRVYFGSDDGVFRCANKTTGDVLWTFEIPSQPACDPNWCEHGLCACEKIRSSPAVDDAGAVYFGAYDHNVYKLDATGAEVWRFSTGGAVYGPVTLDTDGTAFVGSFDGFVYAVDGATGERKWRAAVGAHGDAGWGLAPGPSGAASLVVGQTNEGGKCSSWPPPDVPSWNGTHSCADDCGQCHALALDATTGEEVWRAATKGPGGGGTVAVGADAVSYLLGDWSGTVSGLEITSGANVWSFDFGGDVESRPGLHPDGTAYVSTEDETHALYAVQASTGRGLWQYLGSTETLNSSPAVTDDAVYVGSNDHMLHAVDRATGARLWTFETCANVFSSPAVDDDGVLYVGCNTVTGGGDKGVGQLYAINPKTRLAAARA